MAKIFRKLRENLLGEGNTGKYIKYALGETLLVMVGILLALQVDNWNSNRQDDKSINSFKQKLSLQLDENIFKIDSIVATLQYIETNTQQLHAVIGSENDINTETNLNNLIGLNIVDYHLGLDLNVIIDARENGDLALISSDSLRLSIYDIIVANNQIIERERFANAELNDKLMPYLYKNFNFTNFRYSLINKNLGPSKIYQGDNFKILADQEFENYIFGRIAYRDDFLNRYLDLKNVLQNTKKLL